MGGESHTKCNPDNTHLATNDKPKKRIKTSNIHRIRNPGEEKKRKKKRETDDSTLFRPRRVSICERNLQQEEHTRRGNQQGDRRRRMSKRISRGRNMNFIEETEEEMQI